MPLKIQDYGDWEGDKSGGRHPPACTCVRERLSLTGTTRTNSSGKPRATGRSR